VTQAGARPITTKRILSLLELTNAEISRSYYIFPTPLHNAHEAYGVLAEEFDEFFAYVKQKDSHRDLSGMTGELIQIAAMALRAAIDLVPDESEAR
jgi:hypothetical protein